MSSILRLLFLCSYDKGIKKRAQNHLSMCPHRPPSFFSACVCVSFSLLAPSLHCSAITAGCAVESHLLLLSSENTGPHVSSQQPLTYTQIIRNYSVYVKQTDKRSGCVGALKTRAGLHAVCAQSPHISSVVSTNAIQVKSSEKSEATRV